MELKDFLASLASTMPELFDATTGTADLLPPLTGKNLNDNIIKALNKTEEFKDAKIIPVTMPISEIDGESKMIPTMRLYENTIFRGNVYLYSINLTPPMWSEDDFKPVKNGAYITPKLFNEPNFKPYKTISITFNPESKMDDSRLSNENKLLELFKDIINNPEEYTPKGRRSIMLRLYCENMVVDDGSKPVTIII